MKEENSEGIEREYVVGYFDCDPEESMAGKCGKYLVIESQDKMKYGLFGGSTLKMGDHRSILRKMASQRLISETFQEDYVRSFDLEKRVMGGGGYSVKINDINFQGSSDSFGPVDISILEHFERCLRIYAWEHGFNSNFIRFGD